MQKAFRRGFGVAFVTSIFRTELIADFASAVRQLPPRILVVLDLGRTDRQVDAEKMKVLARLLKDGSIDVLLCTPGELRNFASANGIDTTDLRNGPLIKAVAGTDLLPRVTVIRGQRRVGPPTAIAIVDADVHIVEGDNQSWVPSRTVGGMNAFNAAFINSVAQGRARLDLHDSIRAAVRESLIYWSSID
ncbi:MAG: hypothetical protein CVT62_00905 [Actinobacteria bacterium HGW-Actinobacteria-2]|nr:MAG: hypothetical protein CVT62_00905 [Actinobacteria bacterium HGW-Actinobacteria-2]